MTRLMPVVDSTGSTGAAAGPGATGAVDALLDRAYAQVGWRLLIAYWAIGWSAILAFCIPCGLLFARIERLSPADTRLGFLVGILELVASAGASLVAVIRLTAPIKLWLDHARDPVRALSAWTAAHRLPTALVRSIAAIFAIGAAVEGVLLVHVLNVLPNQASLLVVLGLSVLGTGAMILLITAFGLRVVMRPILRDIASVLEPRVAVTPGSSVRRRLLVGIPLITLVAIYGPVMLTQQPGVRWGHVLQDELIVVAIGLPLALPIAMLIAYSTVQPLGDLLQATERLKRGDFRTRVPELSDDEYGVLARSFNEALEGLADRQRLARANEELLEQIRASRARIVAASDGERRRIERNIHDGAQQRLVALSLDLRMLEEAADSASRDGLRTMASEAGVSLKEALDELRELARGLHPSVLDSDGLGPAIKQLAARAPAPVSISVDGSRLPAAIESTLYFVTAEALANSAKYARASRADVVVEQRNGQAIVRISDDGVGGAAPGAGSGLTGLADRVAALDGSLTIRSPVGRGTIIEASVPVETQTA